MEYFYDYEFNLSKVLCIPNISYPWNYLQVCLAYIEIVFEK